MSDVLHEKYRPDEIGHLLGQDAMVHSLTQIIEGDRSHAFLFTGPSGCGKTTTARAIARAVGCLDPDILEHDAASNTGVDDMRPITQGLRYKPFAEGTSRALIIDECHRLSGNAWDAILKSMEEPPDWAYWFFCTTNVAKVPKTAITRCTQFELRPVPWQLLLSDLIAPIANEEGFTASEKVLGIVCREAQGSPRQALVNLTVCAHARDEKEALSLLKSAAESNAAIDLARALTKGDSWENLLKIIAGLKEENPESVRHVVRAYSTTVILGSKTAKGAQRALAVLDAFSTPFNSTDGISPLVLAVGRLLLT